MIFMDAGFGKIVEGTTMVKKRLVGHNSLIQAIEGGLSKQELMKRFGYKTFGSLKVAYLNALVALDKIPAENNKRRERKVDNVVGINSRGSLVIPKKLVDSLALDKTTLFRVVKDGTDLFLKAKSRPPKNDSQKEKQIAALTRIKVNDQFCQLPAMSLWQFYNVVAWSSPHNDGFV